MSLSSHEGDPPVEVHEACKHLEQGFVFATKFSLDTIFSVSAGASYLLLS